MEPQKQRLKTKPQKDLLHPEELKLLLMAGASALDFEAVEGNALRERGCDEDCSLVKNSWKFFKSAPEEVQLKFVKFET